MTTAIPITARKPKPTVPIYVEWGGKQFGPFESMDAVIAQFEILDEPAPRLQDPRLRPRIAA